MLNKIFFIIILLVGGFTFLSLMATNQLVQMNLDDSPDPCGFSVSYSTVDDYTISGGIDEGSFATTGTEENNSIPGSSQILSTGSNLFCYIGNMGAYSTSLGQAMKIPLIIIQTLQIIFTLVIALGIFWLVYYIGTIFANIFR